MSQVRGAVANLSVVWPFVLRRILSQPQARRDPDAGSWPDPLSALRQPRPGANLPGRVFWIVAGHLLSALHLFVCTSSQAQAHPNHVQPPGHSAPGTHTHAHARVHMAWACSHARGAHWYPGVAERAHTRTCRQLLASTRAPQQTRLLSTRSSPGAGWKLGALNFPPRNPARR